jgi:long-chain fatty acid transport protein
LAFTEDASAVVHNPANLAGLPGAQVLASATFAYSGVEYDGASGSGETDNAIGILPSLFYASALADRDLVFGIGISSPYGQFTEWDKDGPFAFTAPYFAQLTTVNISPTVATRLGDRVRVGAGVDVLWGELTLKSQFPFGLALGDPTVPPGLGKIQVDGTGVGGHAGITVDLTPTHRVALTCRSPVDLDVEGDFTVRRVPPPMAPMLAPSTAVDSEIKFPTVLTLGYGWRAHDRLRVGADVEWIEFSRFDELPLDVAANQSLLPGPSVPQQWEDTWTLNLGLEWDANETWTLRTGYAFLESPIPTDTVAPTLPDADRHLLAVGARYAKQRHRVEFAYAYSIFDDLSVQRNLNPAYSGEYDLFAHLMVISYSLSL